MESLGRGCQPVPSVQWNHRVHFLKVKSFVVVLPQHPQSPSIILRPFGSCCYGDHKQNGMQINTSNNSGKGQGEAGVEGAGGGEGPGNASTCTHRGWMKKRLVEGPGTSQGGASLDSSGRRALRLQRCLSGGLLAGENEELVPPRPASSPNRADRGRAGFGGRRPHQARPSWQGDSWLIATLG